VTCEQKRPAPDHDVIGLTDTLHLYWVVPLALGSTAANEAYKRIREKSDSYRVLQRVFELIAEPTAGQAVIQRLRAGMTSERIKFLLSSEPHESGQFFEHIRIVSVARIEGEWIGFEPDVSWRVGLCLLEKG